MWEPRRFTTLSASMACYSDSFTFLTERNVGIKLTRLLIAIDVIWIEWLDLFITPCTITRNPNQLQWLTINLQPNLSSLTAENSLNSDWTPSTKLSYTNGVKSQSQSYFTTGGLPSISSSWQQSPRYSWPINIFSSRTLAVRVLMYS
jgi:hypothetical protein